MESTYLSDEDKFVKFLKIMQPTLTEEWVRTRFKQLDSMLAAQGRKMQILLPKPSAHALTGMQPKFSIIDDFERFKEAVNNKIKNEK